MDLIKAFLPNYNLLIVQSLAVALTALLIPRLKVTSIFGPIMTVLALAWINTKFWDAALFFKIPNEFSTQMLLLFLINGFIFLLVVKLLPGIEVSGILPALAAPIVFSLSTIIIAEYFTEIDWTAVYNFIVELFAQAKTNVAK